MLLCQKFLGLLFVKMMLTWQLPTLRDQSFLFLLGLHLSTFFYFHTRHGKGLMKRIMKSKVRFVTQETFKGYGKALNLLSSIHKALKLDADPIYFVFVLVVRCSISAIFKSFILKVIIKRKKFKTKRAKTNLIYNAIPSLIVYFAILLGKHLLDLEDQHFLELRITMVFTMFMVISRCIRSFWKLRSQKKQRNKKKLKAKL